MRSWPRCWLQTLLASFAAVRLNLAVGISPATPCARGGWAPAEHATIQIRKIELSFSAVKARSFIREFAARGEDAGTASEAYLARRTMAPLLDVLEEMDMLTRLHRDGLLSDAEYASKRTLVLERL